MKSIWNNILITLIIAILLAASVCNAAQKPPARIVSLAPGLTELCCAIGLEKNLVGITTYCDRPASVKGKPTVGGPANPSLEAVLNLKPDVVLLDEEGDGHKLAERFRKLGIQTVIFQGARLSRLAPAIRSFGEQLGAASRADKLAVQIETALGRHRHTAAPVRTLFVIWPDPLMAAGPGTVLDDIMNRTGFSNIAGDARSVYPRLSLEAVIARNPQLIIVGQGEKLGLPMKRLLKQMQSLDAVKQGRVCMVSDALYRPGPRIPEGIAELEKCLTLADRSRNK